MWRPKNWETVKIGSRMWKEKPLTSSHEAFEAGADAMIEALKQEIKRVENPQALQNTKEDYYSVQADLGFEHCRQKILSLLQGKEVK
jgi:hypothetical protein